MKFGAKLPKSYYAYVGVDLESQSKDDRQRIAISLSTYQACKIEKYRYEKNGMSLQELFKRTLVEKNVVTKEDVNLKVTTRKKFDFMKNGEFNCESYANIGAGKQYLLYVSSYAKTKIIQYMLKNDIDLVWFMKQSFIEKGILTVEDLSK